MSNTESDSEINPFSPPIPPALKAIKPIKWSRLNPLERFILIAGCVVGMSIFTAFIYWVAYEDPIDRQERIERRKWCNQEPSCPKFYGEPYPEK